MGVPPGTLEPGTRRREPRELARTVAARRERACWRRDLARTRGLGAWAERGLAVKRLGVMVLAGLLLCIGVQQGQQRSVMAQTTAGERAFVYGINAAIPGNFVGTFAPPSADAIFLLADGTSVISPRFTEIYFWPITNAFRANWSALNEPVPGVLEVVSNGHVIAELSPTDYTILFSQEGTATTAKLFLGQDAIDADADFRARQKAFNEASAAYHQAELAWLDAVDKENARKQAGETVTLPPE